MPPAITSISICADRKCHQLIVKKAHCLLANKFVRLSIQNSVSFFLLVFCFSSIRFDYKKKKNIFFDTGRHSVSHRFVLNAHFQSPTDALFRCLLLVIHFWCAQKAIFWHFALHVTEFTNVNRILWIFCDFKIYLNFTQFLCPDENWCLQCSDLCKFIRRNTSFSMKIGSVSV